jgi:hypothetical protein
MQPSDLNSDGIVDSIDLSILVSRWGSSDATADINSDGTVDALDLSVLVSNWGTVPSTYQVLASWSSSADSFDANFGTMYSVESAGSFGERLSWTQAPGQAAGAEWNQTTLGAALATQTLRWVAVFSGWPTESGFSIAQGVDETSGSVNRWRIDISTTGLLRIRDAGGTVVQESDDPVPLNTEVRFEAIRDGTVMTVHAFSPATTTTPLITISGTVGSPVNRIRIGQTFSSTIVPTFTADEIIVTDHAGIVGPPEPAGPPTVPEPPTNVTATAGVNEATISWTAAYDGGSPITEYEVTVSPSTGVSGATTRLTGSSASSFVFTGLAEAIGYSFVVRAINSVGSSAASDSSNSVTLGIIENPAGMQLVLNEEFDSFNPSINGSNNTSTWDVETSTYGSPARIGRYRSENVIVSAGSGGHHGTNTLKLISKRETYIDRDFTAGMVGTRSRGANRPDGWYGPHYGRYEIRCKTPHGQGLWPAFWLRHRDGSSVCEPDILEYFHQNNPGYANHALHRLLNGSLVTNVTNGSAYFESPTYESGWHIFALDILQDPSGVRFIWYIDGTIVKNFLDEEPQDWRDRYTDRAFDICIQGCQIGNAQTGYNGGVGHPDDPLGYDRWRNNCARGGTAPNSCNTSYAGEQMLEWQNGSDAVFEVDYVRVWEYTG